MPIVCKNEGGECMLGMGLQAAADAKDFIDSGGILTRNQTWQMRLRWPCTH